MYALLILLYRGSPWAASLLLCFHVHVLLSPFLNFFFVPPELVHFEINDGKKLPSSVITFVNEIDSLQL